MRSNTITLLPPTGELVADIRNALSSIDLDSRGPITTLANGRTYAIGATTVLKQRHRRQEAFNYLYDLATFTTAGVPAEEALFPTPVAVGDQWAVLTRRILPNEPTSDRHAHAVGALLRRIHDGVWPYSDLREDGEVYCPNDWFKANVLIRDGEPVQVDLDLAKCLDRDSAVKMAMSEFLQGSGPDADDRFLSGYGPHPDLRF